MTHQWKKLPLSGCTASEITTALCLWDAVHAAYVPIPSDKIQRTRQLDLTASKIALSCSVATTALA